MADQFKFAQLQTFTLAGSGAVIGATSIILNSMTDIDGNPLTMSGTFGSIGFGTLDPGSGTSEEQISFTGLVNNANGTVTLTGVCNIGFTYPYTSTSGLLKTHVGGAKFIISNTSGFYDKLTSKSDDETITGLWDFPSGVNNPTIGSNTYVAPTAQTQIATKGYVDAVATGTTTYDANVVAGIAGENLTIGNSVYLNTSDGKWYKTDASNASKSQGVILGIAQATASSAASVNILISGLDKNQSGLVAGTTYYLSNTPGAISAVAGSFSVVVGECETVTSQLLVQPRFTQIPTQSEKAAMAGTVGTPSATNLFVTNNDTTGTGSLIRSTALPFQFGGDGTDGALSITSGTTTIDLANAAVVVKNYTSISITGTGKLAFSNPNTNGTIIVLKSQGNVTLTSSQTPMIDASALGAAGGAAVTNNGTNSNGNSGSAAYSPIFLVGAGGAGVHNTTTAVSGGTIGAQSKSQNVNLLRYTIVAPGSGGGSGASSDVASSNAVSGKGGKGGAGLIIECNGAWNFTTASGISVAGEAGGNGSYAGSRGYAQGGSGGGGGTFIALYKTLTANSGTVTVTGGAAGTSTVTAGAGTSQNAGPTGGSSTNNTSSTGNTASANNVANATVGADGYSLIGKSS